LICDEPVSALDLSIRAQIMNVFLDLQQELGMAACSLRAIWRWSGRPPSAH